MNGRLAGKRAIITGAGNGIGLAIARHFAREGARIGLVDVAEGAVQDAAATIGEAALPLTADHGSRRIALAWRKSSPREAEFKLLGAALRDIARSAAPDA